MNFRIINQYKEYSNLHRQFEIQMLVENHKSRPAAILKWSRVDLRPEMSVLLGVWKRCYGPEISI